MKTISKNFPKRPAKAIGVALVVFAFLLAARYSPQTSNASTNMNSTNHWAWNDAISWIDFYGTGNVNVTSQQLQGYASSSAGDISLDCHTTRSGNICGSSSYQVYNDGSGNLTGWGWNDVYGWISFCGGQNTSNCPGSVSSYQVVVNPTTGIFTDGGLQRNYAWNDVIGWISFNCDNGSGCGTSAYKVQTGWVATSTSGYVESSTFDTGISGGAEINSILWHGTLPGGTSVVFQLAVSNSSSGPWTYQGAYTGTPGTPINIDYALHNNARYFRYTMTLNSNQAQTASPRVDDVNVNWSR